MAAAQGNQPGDRFTGVFSTFMAFCLLVWLWSFSLFLFWPWQQGGQWLPDFPILAVCADDQVCSVPHAELAEAKAAGKVKSLELPEDAGETTYEMLHLQWKKIKGGVEAKLSTWNFQTVVRYRIEDEQPVLVEYQEINGKLFLYAIGGALVTLAGLLIKKRLNRSK